MRKQLALIIFALAISPWVSAQDAYELKGDSLGMTLSAFKERYFREVPWTPTKYAPYCSDENPQGSTIEVEERLRPIMVNCRQHFPFEEGRAPKTTIAGVNAYINYFFLVRDAANPNQAVLFRIEATFREQGFVGVMQGFVEKYGQPADFGMETLQNRAGASFQSAFLTWRNRAGHIHLRQRAGTIDDSRVSIVDDALLAEFSRRSQEAHKDRARDL